MNQPGIKGLQLRVLLLVAVLASAGCAVLDNRPPEQVVAERAQAWADALLDSDLEGAWALTSPGFREHTAPEGYFRYIAGAGRWTGAEL